MLLGKKKKQQPTTTRIKSTHLKGKAPRVEENITQSVNKGEKIESKINEILSKKKNKKNTE